MTGGGRLALFDLDNTLVDRTAAFARAAAAFADDHGLDPAAAVAFIVEQDDDGRVEWGAWMPAVRERFDLAPTVDELLDAHRPRYLAAYTLDPATADALRELRAHGWRIGIVTNGPAGQEDKIRRTGLDALVDGWAVSDLAGVRKPEPAIFAAAARACGAARDDLDTAWVGDAWMVGDSAPADIAGAHHAGLRSVWLHRGRTWAAVAHEPDPFARARSLPTRPLPPDYAPTAHADDIPAAVAHLLAT